MRYWPRSALALTAWLSIAALAAAPARAQDEAAPAQVDLTHAIVALASELRALPQLATLPYGDVHVGDVKVSGLALTREVFYRAGKALVDGAVLDLALDAEHARQVAAGTSAAELRVDEAALEARVAEATRELEAKTKRKLDEELARTGRDREVFVAEQRRLLRLERLFFRGAPAKWPERTWEALDRGSGGHGKAFAGKLLDKTGDKPAPPNVMEILRHWVLSDLKKSAGLRFATDGLPASTCLAAGSAELTTVEAAKLIERHLPPQEIETALLDAVLEIAARSALEKAGAWLDDKTAAERFAEYRKQNDSTPFTTEVLATSFKGYPSLEVFRSRWRLERSFESMIGDSIDQAALAKFEASARSFLGNGRVSVRVLRIARGDARGKAALRRERIAAERVAGRLRAGELTFAEAVRTHGTVSGAAEDGLLSNQALNPLGKALGENEYRDLTTGFSVAKHALDELPVGRVSDPLPGRGCYYVIEVVERTPGTPGAGQQFLRELYVRDRFHTWARELAARTIVR